MKRITVVLIIILQILCIYAKSSNAQPVVFSAGIQGGAGFLGEVLPDDSDSGDSRIKTQFNLEWGFSGEVKFIQTGNWFHDIYCSYGRSKGTFAFNDYKNHFKADSYTVMYRIGGFIAGRDGEYSNFFMFAGAGLALDRYRSGDFSSDTNSMLAGRPYLVRPVFGLGGGIMFERITINLLELRMDIRFQRQPQDDFQDYMHWNINGESSHWLGSVGLYSGIAYNF